MVVVADSLVLGPSLEGTPLLLVQVQMEFLVKFADGLLYPGHL